MSVGGQLHYWLNDHFKVGFMSNSNDENDLESQLQAADLMFRLSAASWIKVQGSQSEGFIAQTLSSDDGGYEFDGVGSAALIEADAGAYRADISNGEFPTMAHSICMDESELAKLEKKLQ